MGTLCPSGSCLRRAGDTEGEDSTECRAHFRRGVVVRQRSGQPGCANDGLGANYHHACATRCGDKGSSSGRKTGNGAETGEKSVNFILAILESATLKLAIRCVTT